MKYIVRTCTGREEFAKYVQDKIPDVIVSLDTQKQAVKNIYNAMLLAGDDPCIHFEDDILITDNFKEKALAVIKDRPDMLVQFFSMRKADLKIGSRIESGRTFLMSQCFYTPPKMSRGIKNFYLKWDRLTTTHSHNAHGVDLLIQDYLKLTKQKYYIHVPSLVDHRICKSAIDPRRSTKRQSLTYRQT